MQINKKNGKSTPGENHVLLLAYPLICLVWLDRCIDLFLLLGEVVKQGTKSSKGDEEHNMRAKEIFSVFSKNLKDNQGNHPMKSTTDNGLSRP